MMAESETPAKLEIVFSKALTLEIPSSEPTSVTSSPQSLSPTGVLDSSCGTSASCSSLPISRRPSLNVKFAPLPELAPRKRRSTAPLGMAARAQLVRRRRGYQDPDQGPRYNAGTNPMWTEAELAEARMKQIAAAMERERQRREEAGGYDPNDPLVVLGKKMKEASKQLWKKVSKKDMKEAAAPSSEKGEGEEAAKGKESESSSDGSLDGKPPSMPVSPEVRSRCDSSAAPATKSAPTPSSSTPSSSKPPTPIDPNAPLRSILISSTPPPPLPERTRTVEVVQQMEEEEEGGVWEEEIDPHFPLNASQAETSFDSLSVSRRRSVMLNVSNFPVQSSSSDDCSTPTNANPNAELDAAAGESPSTIQQNQGP